MAFVDGVVVDGLLDDAMVVFEDGSAGLAYFMLLDGEGYRRCSKRSGQRCKASGVLVSWLPGEILDGSGWVSDPGFACDVDH